MKKQKNKKKGFFCLFFLTAFLFSGCSLSGKPDGGLYKSVDGGKTFTQKSWTGGKLSLSNQAVLALEIDPQNSQIIYLGTDQLGLLRSTDGGENWARDNGGYNTVTSIAISQQDSQVIYFSAKKANRGKVFKSQNGGKDWEEIYTEKNDGSVVTVLNIDPKNDQDILMGNSKGGLFRSLDGGTTWSNLFWAKNGISRIVRDPFNKKIFYFGTTISGAWRTEDEGDSFQEMVKSDGVNNLVVDKQKEGRIYLSNKKGLQVSEDRGKTWQLIKTLTKPEEVNSRGLAIDDHFQRIFYSSGKTLYQSLDGGKTWMTSQFDITRPLDIIKIDPFNKENVFIGVGRKNNQTGLFPF